MPRTSTPERRSSGDGSPDLTLAQRIAAHVDRLRPAERRVALYVRSHLEEVAFSSADEIGQAAGTSDATVVRTARALGYDGLPGLKRAAGASLAATTRPTALLRQRIERTEGRSAEIAERIFHESSEVLAETHRVLDLADLDRAADLLQRADTTLVYGVGLSGAVADYLAMRLSRIGLRAHAARETGFVLADVLAGLRPDDAVILVAPARLIRELDLILGRSTQLAIPVVLITDALDAIVGDRIEVSLKAVLSPSGMVGEALAAIAVADALVLATAARDEGKALEVSELVNALRSSLGVV